MALPPPSGLLGYEFHGHCILLNVWCLRTSNRLIPLGLRQRLRLSLSQACSTVGLGRGQDVFCVPTCRNQTGSGKMQTQPQCPQLSHFHPTALWGLKYQKLSTVSLSHTCKMWTSEIGRTTSEHLKVIINSWAISHAAEKGPSWALGMGANLLCYRDRSGVSSQADATARSGIAPLPGSGAAQAQRVTAPLTGQCEAARS